MYTYGYLFYIPVNVIYVLIFAIKGIIKKRKKEYYLFVIIFGIYFNFFIEKAFFPSMDFALAAALSHFFSNSKSVCSMIQVLRESESAPRSSRSSITASALSSTFPSALPSFQPSALPSAFSLFKSSYGENDNTVLLLYNMLKDIDKKPKQERYYPLA